MAQTILFIGSNPNKKRHSRPAKEKGYKTILLKDKPVDFDYEYFDDIIVCDYFDCSTLLKKVIDYNKKNKIDACLTRFEPFVPIVGLICEKLNLIGPSLKSALSARDKILMREAFQKANIPQPKFFKIESIVDLKKAASLLGYPFLLKPISGAKSRFILKINKISELEEKYNLVLKLCKHNKITLFRNYKGLSGYNEDYQKKLIAEELLMGKQVTTTSLVFNNSVEHIEMADLVTAQDLGIDAFYLVSRTTPSILSDAIKNEVYNISTNAINALGLNNVPVHPEFIITKDGPKVIEIGARIGGYRCEMTEFAFGIKLNEAAINISLGKKLDLEKKYERASTATEYWLSKSGIIKHIKNIDEIKKMEGVFEFSLKKKAGDNYITPPHGDKPLATFFTVAKKPEEAKRIADEVMKKIKVEVT